MKLFIGFVGEPVLAADEQLAWYTRTLMVIGSVIYAGWELWAGYLKYAMTMVITSLNDINAGKPMGMAYLR